MLYMVATMTIFVAASDAERAIAAASAAAWPSGKRSLPSTKVGLCHTKLSHPFCRVILMASHWATVLTSLA